MWGERSKKQRVRREQWVSRLPSNGIHRPDFSAGMKKKHPRPHGLREVCSQAHLGTLGYTSCPFNC